MLFRSKNGKLIEINKKDYIDDKDYYRAISGCYGFIFNDTNSNMIETILALSKKKNVQ